MERIDPIKLTGLKGRLANPMMKNEMALMKITVPYIWLRMLSCQ